MPWSMALRTQVGQRVADGLDDRLVQLGLLALQVDAHLLAAGDRQVADHAGELVPDVADRLHARLHDVDLQLGGQQVEPLHGAQEGGVLLGRAELHDLVARQHQLADQGHELVEQADVHADGGVGDGRRARLRRLGGGGFGRHGRAARRSRRSAGPVRPRGADSRRAGAAPAVGARTTGSRHGRSRGARRVGAAELAASGGRRRLRQSRPSTLGERRHRSRRAARLPVLFRRSRVWISAE